MSRMLNSSKLSIEWKEVSDNSYRCILDRKENTKAKIYYTTTKITSITKPSFNVYGWSSRGYHERRGLEGLTRCLASDGKDEYCSAGMFVVLSVVLTWYIVNQLSVPSPHTTHLHPIKHSTIDHSSRSQTARVARPRTRVIQISWSSTRHTNHHMPQGYCRHITTRSIYILENQAQ